MRIVSILGAAAVAVVTLSLDTASGGEAVRAKEGGTFRIVDAGLFGTIDPALLSNFPEGTILRPTCAALMAFPDKPLPAGLKVAPDLAERPPVVSKNGRTYTFTIRKDARFSSGERVTARHFVRAIERIFDPAMQSPQVVYLDTIVGAKAVLEGKATRISGAVARGRTLILRLTRAVPDFPLLIAPPALCAVPANLPADREGARAPLHSPAPYYVAQFVPGNQVVLERNRFYRGPRPHHVDRFVADLTGDVATVFDQVLSGKADYALGPPAYFADTADDLARRFGVNKSQFFVVQSPGVRMFALNTSRPLFRSNVKLRQAVNFAVDRKVLTRELGPHAGTPSDQFMPATMPGYRDERIYPLGGPDLRIARALAAGRTRSGKAVLYTTNLPVDVAQADILRKNLAKIGLELEIKQFPIPLLFERMGTSGEPFDIGRVNWVGFTDPGFLNFLFDGRTIGQQSHGNWSYLNSTKYNRLLDRASRLSGDERYRAYGELDVRLSRDAAPAIPYGLPNSLTLVSSRVGCVVVNPDLDLTAVCLK